MNEVKEQVVYVEFYLAGDCIFSCQKSWLPNPGDMAIQAAHLANVHKTDVDLIKWTERIVELPITLPKGFLEGIGISLHVQ